MKKRIISMILACMMIFSLLPTAVLAAGPECNADNCTHVASIGTMHYATLQEAVTAATDGNTIKLLEDVDVGTSYLTINKGITLDFGEHKVTGSRSGSAPVVCLQVDAAGKTVIFTGTTGGIQPATGTGCVCVKNGELKIESGVYTTTDGSIAVDDYGTKSLTINGGTFTANLSSGYGRMINDFAGDVTINGGTFKFENTGNANYMYLIEMDGNDNTCAINGGTFEIIGKNAYIYIVCGDRSAININGGNINARGTGFHPLFVPSAQRKGMVIFMTVTQCVHSSVSTL